MNLNLKQRATFATKGLGYLIAGHRESAAVSFVAAATGNWEGHQRNRFRDRPRTSLASQDSDMDLGTREAMMSEARALAQTFGIVKRIMRAFGTYCVGSCQMKWNTGDVEVDRAYRKYWRECLSMMDANGVHNFQKLTRIVVVSTIRDGDIFGQKVVDNGYGQVRLIEADRVNSNGTMTCIDTPEVVGGIGVNKRGQRVFARTWDRATYGTYKNKKEIPWAEIFHVFDSDRADAVRGVTHFHTALDIARDYKEMKEAERLSSKRLSKWALKIKTHTGAAPTQDLYGDNSPNQQGGEQVNVNEVNSVADAYMFPGEDMEAIENERPSAGWQWLMQDLIRELSIGLDLPYGVVWNMSGLGGPAARFEINQAARTFNAFNDDVLEPKWLIPVAGWKIAEGMNTGQIPFHPNWHNFKPQKPVYITIDLGRDSTAGINENKAALLTATSWFEENGKDFEEETEVCFQEEKFRQDMADKYKVDKNAVRIINPNQPIVSVNGAKE